MRYKSIHVSDVRNKMITTNNKDNKISTLYNEQLNPLIVIIKCTSVI